MIPKSVSKYMSEIGRKGGQTLTPKKLAALRELATRPRKKTNKKVKSA
jgi:hypothetical protein